MREEWATRATIFDSRGNNAYIRFRNLEKMFLTCMERCSLWLTIKLSVVYLDNTSLREHFIFNTYGHNGKLCGMTPENGQ
jgi:hypothetical protein